MKFKKILNIILLVFILINTFQSYVNASLIPMEEVYIEDLGECERHIQYHRESDGVWSYIITNIVGYRIDGKFHYAYCMQRDRKGVGGEQEGYNVKISEMLKNPEVWRAIINGFPYKTAEELDVKNDDDAFVATKQAIYCVMYNWNVDLRYVGVDDEGWRIVDAIRRIVNSARNGTDTPDKSDVLTINKVGELKKESDNYYSQEFEVHNSVEMESYEISDIKNFPKGSFSTDMNNNKKTIFTSGKNFKILIPTNKINENFEGIVRISGNLKTYPIFYGESYDKEKQDYALTYDSFEKISAETSIKVNAYKSKLKIYKTDSETNKPIEGVEFNFKYEDGINIGNYKTDKNGTIEISNLKQGKIIVTEIKTQEKYILDENKREIVLGYEEEKSLDIENERKKGNINILKIDKDNKNLTLEGVEFDLLDSTGKNVIKHVKTDKNGKAEIKNLDIGKYILRETKTKKEYKIALDQNVTIEWGKTLNITVENEKMKGKIKITKTSEDDNLITGEKAGTPIENVKFEIYDNSGKLVDTLITKTDGIAISKDLAVGKYIIKETETGKYYEINEKDFEVEITKNGELVDLKISNKSKTPPPEKPKEEIPPKEETPKTEVPPVEPLKKLPVTGY